MTDEQMREMFRRAAVVERVKGRPTGMILLRPGPSPLASAELEPGERVYGPNDPPDWLNDECVPRDLGALPVYCPECDGEMQPYDDGEYTSRCEDCGWVRP